MQILNDIRLSRAPSAAFAAEGLFWGGFAALVPVLKAQIGLSDGQFGVALLVSSFGAVMAMALAPVVSRLLGASEMRVCAAFMATAFLLPGMANSGVIFAIAMMLCAIGSGTLDVLMNARVSDIEAKSRRPLMNLNHAIFSFAYASSALFAGFAREIGLTPFQVFAILFLVTMVLILGMGGSDGRSDDTHEGGASQSKLSWMLLAPAGAIVLIAFMTEQATEGWSALHLERNLGAGAAMGALGPAILGLTMGVGRLSGQFMAAHYSEAFVIRVAAVLAAFGTTLAAISPSLWMAYLGFAILGLGVSVVAPMAFAWIGRVVPDRHRVQAISRVAVIGYAGFFIGPPLMGFLSEGFGLNTSFAAIAIILLIVPVVLVPMLKRRAAIA